MDSIDIIMRIAAYCDLPTLASLFRTRRGCPPVSKWADFVVDGAMYMRCQSCIIRITADGFTRMILPSGESIEVHHGRVTYIDRHARVYKFCPDGWVIEERCSTIFAARIMSCHRDTKISMCELSQTRAISALRALGIIIARLS